MCPKIVMLRNQRSDNVEEDLIRVLRLSLNSRFDLLALDEALAKLSKMGPLKSQIVEMRFFAVLSFEEIAETLGISARAPKRDWMMPHVNVQGHWIPYDWRPIWIFAGIASTVVLLGFLFTFSDKEGKNEPIVRLSASEELPHGVPL